MTKPKMFIASSGAAEPLALELIAALNKKEISCEPWRGAFDSDEYFLTSLRKKAEKFDFAAVLLTEDDKEVKKGNRLIVPRDNCIFELGFFMAALGKDPMRCIMLSSLSKEQAFPSDLAGRTYIQISPKGKDRQASIRNAAKKVMESVRRLGPLERRRGQLLRFITADQLMRREKPSKMNGDLIIEQGTKAVVVNSAEPIERDFEMATKVHQNMKYGVTYEYFFGSDGGNEVFVANLIQMLALIGTTKTEPEESGRLQLMKRHADKVRANLKLMQSQMSIHFRQRPPLQFCVHNASRPKDAVCYLRCESEDFVIWRENADAKAVADELTRSCKTKQLDQRRYIFHSTDDVDFKSQSTPFTTSLRGCILERFPALLRKKAEAACFEDGPHE